jgi:hypothetical protein
LRALLDGGEAAVLSVNLDALFDDKSLDAKLHRLRLGPGRGVRDLAVFENGFAMPIVTSRAAQGCGRWPALARRALSG